MGVYRFFFYWGSNLKSNRDKKITLHLLMSNRHAEGSEDIIYGKHACIDLEFFGYTFPGKYMLQTKQSI